MHKIKGVALENVVNIGEAYLPFDDKFVCVTGLNKDSRISTTQNNASGKSTLFSAIANILYESDPMSAKRDRKAMLQSKDSKIQIDLESNEGNDLTVVQTATKYFCSNSEDGDLKPHKIADAQRIMHEYFPITEDEFYAYCYVNGNKPFAFQHDTEQGRFRFLAKLFRLDIYDVIRSHIKKEREVAAKSKVQYDAIAENVAMLRKELETNDWSEDKAPELEESTLLLSKFEKESISLMDKKANMEADSKYFQKREKYLAMLKRAKKLIGKREISKASLRELESMQDAIDSYETYKEELKSYKKKKEKLLAAISKLGVGEGVDSIEKLREKFSQLADEIESLEEKIDKAQREDQRMNRLIGKITEYECDLSMFDSEKLLSRKELTRSLNNFDQVIDTAEAIGKSSECPTCGQKVNLKKLNEKAKAARKGIREINALMEKLELYEALVQLREELSELEKIPAVDIPKLQKKLKAKNKALNYVERVGKRLAENMKLTAELNALKKPKKVAKPKSLDNIEDVIEAMSNAITADRYLSDLPKTSFDEKAYKKLTLKIKKRNKKYSALRKQNVALSVASSQFRSLTSRIKQAEEQMAKLKEAVDRKKLLDAMFKLYGKELKSAAINDRLAQLESVMNANAHLVFSERMKFSFKAVDDKVSATVLRGNGVPSDVSKLSGSESNCFRMLFAYSLLPTLPSERRTNFMVLDEPDAACDDEVRSHIIKHFVPHLRNTVPNVFWLTPKDVSCFDDCEHWRVIKEDGIATLHKVVR